MVTGVSSFKLGAYCVHYSDRGLFTQVMANSVHYSDFKRVRDQ
jgi:hypothetical protein